ncbi:hypothetical protein CW357_00915 [Rummeliibacillus sp. TYF005]|uniref:hypothetical protein n=1 Tax=Rummeliibacillus sp. TYF005 TaxID=2058214 RepID=UPI000F5232FB|nr:hypothetical protein [Rummeliibacillus sp. TYF005]RPJ97260.1 hypothetical protein CW357_00915 [Rummeliibacillus sp. TYF005]
MKEYALYKGENIVGIGTLEELANQKGVQIRTIKFYLTPTYKHRLAKRKKVRNALELVEI